MPSVPSSLWHDWVAKEAMMQTHPFGTCIAGRYEVAGLPLMDGMEIVYLCNLRQEGRTGVDAQERHD